MILAAIDIGSNAARLLISEVRENSKGKTEFIKLNLLRIPLRLGIDVFLNGEIGEERKKMLLDTLQVFCSLMKIYKVEQYRACATSAMRDARNGNLILEEIQKNANIKVEIISGDEEAGLIYENHIAETLDKKFSYLYIDVGGGSTEVMYFENGKIKYKKSFNIGTLRLLHNLVTKKQWDDMNKEIRNVVAGKKNIYAIGSGGNINKVFSMSKTKDKKPISLHTIKMYLNALSDLSIEERMARYNLREDRADVIVPALQIFQNILHKGNISKIYVPKISVADGLIRQIYSKAKA